MPYLRQPSFPSLSGFCFSAWNASSASYGIKMKKGLFNKIPFQEFLYECMSCLCLYKESKYWKHVAAIVVTTLLDTQKSCRFSASLLFWALPEKRNFRQCWKELPWCSLGSSSTMLLCTYSTLLDQETMS